MTGADKLKYHAGLVDKMAAALGVDLEEAMLRRDGPTIDDLTDAVLRCTKCPDPVHCAAWLMQRSGKVGDTPGYCLNRDTLRHLSAR